MVSAAAISESTSDPSSMSTNPETSLSAVHRSTTEALATPTSDSHDFDDPNLSAHSSTSEASQRARKTAILAAFLILGALGALGGGVLCFRCGLLPCCSNKRRHRRGPSSTARVVEEGLRGLQKMGPVAREKPVYLIPGKGPSPGQIFNFPSLPRNPPAQMHSRSNGPRQYLNGSKRDASGKGEFRVYATNEEGDFEDVTHILISDADADPYPHKPVTDDASSASSRSPRESTHSTKSTTTHASGRSSQLVRMSTATVDSGSLSVNTRASRASEGATSMTAESYTTCESRYSTPSIERDRPPSAFDPISEESEDEYHTPAPNSPASSSASTTSGGSMSLLLMTPEEPNYTGLADAALPRVVTMGVAGIPGVTVGASRTESVTGSEDMDLDMEDSEWDVAGVYGGTLAGPLPPVPEEPSAPEASGKGRARSGKSVKSVKGRPQTGVGLVNRVGAVAVGGRTCVLMHG